MVSGVADTGINFPAHANVPVTMDYAVSQKVELRHVPANTGTFAERLLNVRFSFAERSLGTFWERSK